MYLMFADLQILLFVKDARQGNETNMLANLLSISKTLQSMQVQPSQLFVVTSPSQEKGIRQMFLPWMVALHAFRRLPCLLAKCHLNEDAPDFEMVA